ncbi:hypothetical protein GCM10009841_14410 [Microlunatus panaciterrae]|uniref:non-specific serine/threonine protein kinase n=1 Tax=Microlunatus panaciterrae TaxID=400768 RepID=A0ABS2RLX9_9ACTN|nr:serine/threonine-protein kinase [Microlunatus panaciterrae]MBM7800001.1 serine/threonine protein kinase [Microlunatus panaciterrae]
MLAPDALIAGRYRLVELVGSGGMGVVWKAWDDRLHRAVALKLLHQQAQLSDAESELATQRAMREARITARLHHRHAVPVFDVVEHEGQPCLIMQFVPSHPLSAVLRDRGTLEPAEAAAIGVQVASALAAAHQVGIVHRDVKPGNVLIAEDGSAMISDFGISRAMGDVSLTTTGLVHGTPAYLSPEVARGEESSSKSDVFSLGATLYAAIEGAPPFGKDQNSMALLHKVASGDFEPPRRSGRLTPVLESMLSVDPADRPSMTEVASLLADVGGVSAESGGIEPTVAFPAAAAEPAAGEPPTATPTTVSPTTRTPGAEAYPPAGEAAAVAGARTWPPATAARPSSTPAADRPSPPARRRTLTRAAVVVGVLLVLTILAASVVPLLNGPDSAAPPADPSQSSAPVPSQSSSAAPSASSQTSATSSRTSATPSKTRSPSTSPKATPTASKSSSAKNAPTAAQLAQAISSYYALVPGKTEQAWKLLTPSYQNRTAGGRKSYQKFWKDIDQVSVSKVSGTPPDGAVATVTYRFKDGKVVEERTSYRLVNDGGVLKINDSSVLSSSTK